MAKFQKWWARQGVYTKLAFGVLGSALLTKIIPWLLDKAATLAYEKFLEFFISPERAAGMTASILSALLQMGEFLRDERVSWAITGGAVVAFAIVALPILGDLGRKILRLPRGESADALIPQAGTRAVPRPGEAPHFSDFDLRPLDPPLKVVGIRSEDGTAVHVKIRIQNFAASPRWQKILEAYAEVGSDSGKGGGSLNNPFHGGRSEELTAGAVYVFSSLAGQRGRCRLSLLYGKNSETARTVINFYYDFEICADPSAKDKAESVAVKVLNDGTEYTFIESELQKRQQKSKTAAETPR